MRIFMSLLALACLCVPAFGNGYGAQIVQPFQSRVRVQVQQAYVQPVQQVVAPVCVEQYCAPVVQQVQQYVQPVQQIQSYGYAQQIQRVRVRQQVVTPYRAPLLQLNVGRQRGGY